VLAQITSISFSDKAPNASVQIKNEGIASELIKIDAPQSYVVKANDTSLKIAQLYVNKISDFPQLMGKQTWSEIELKSGDSLQLLSRNGIKLLLLSRQVVNNSNSSTKYIKLTPMIKTTGEQFLPTISADKLNNLLMQPLVLEESQNLNKLPYIVSGGEVGQSLYSMGDLIYVKGLTNVQIGSEVAIISPFRILTDPDSKQQLATEVYWNGSAIVEQLGELITLRINSAVRPIAPLDRVLLLPVNDVPKIAPHKAKPFLQGKIIGLYDALTSTAEANSVALNLGSNDGVDVGSVFDVYSSRVALDPNSKADKPQYLALPKQIIGEIMVYKVYPRVSFALVTDSSHPIRLFSSFQSQE
ncbi:MAG: hypothetical protein RLZZ293_307, partial [Pseudomonadota bacterium]